MADTQPKPEKPTPEQIRADVEKIVEHYCDGTWNGLKRATFIEYFSDGTNGPQELADRLIEYIGRLSC
jgi:hypothetical protein